MMGDSLTRDSANTIADEIIRSRERKGKSPSPLSTVRFLPPKVDTTGPSPPLEAHELDIESPSATIRRKEQGQGIVYHPPENLAEFLDSSLVPPVSGRSALIGQRTFFDECSDPMDGDSLSTPTKTAKELERSGACSMPVLIPVAVEHFYCAFCMRDRPGSTRRRFAGNGGCSHLFCKECLEDYLFQRIRVGHHSFHPCPKMGEEGCRASATSDDVRCIVRVELFEEHRRRLGGLSGPCEACGIRGSRPSTPLIPTTATSTPRAAASATSVPITTDADASCCQSCGSSPSHTSARPSGSPGSTSERLKVLSREFSKEKEDMLHIESEKALAEIEAEEVTEIDTEIETETEMRVVESTCRWSCCFRRERTRSPTSSPMRPSLRPERLWLRRLHGSGGG